MAWRLARSLEHLRNQVNQAYPSRSKANDGTIGDSAHASGPSDHNPNGEGVVCALDLTHDPAHGFDAHALANRLLGNRHPNLKYVISNDRIGGSHTNWQWTAYQPSNPYRNRHDKHIHVSVGVGGEGTSRAGTYDNTTNWDIGGSDMYQGKSAEQWARDFTNATNVAEARRKLLGQVVSAAGVDTGKTDPDQAVPPAIQLIDAKNKLIAKLEAGQQVTQAELDSLSALADKLSQDIKNANK